MFAIIYNSFSRFELDVIPHLEELRIAKAGYPYYGSKKTKSNKNVKSGPKQLYVTVSLGVAEKKGQYKKQLVK
ncbi:hypothetical protein [Natranaerovirga hydrolytica]|uniref:hypothetical protein n=1 Tax=Natranaerovirga hydrolytica TaxID=680378 RepID=UPI00104D7F7D|nr:hypothetical protein [Natranaerovirga hydrolytica]